MIDRITSAPSFQAAQPVRAEGEKRDAQGEASVQDTATIGGGKEEKEWTVLFYFDGKNNLAPMAKSSFSSIAKVGSDENVNLVAELAVGTADVQRGYVTGEKSKELFPGSEVIGQRDMGDPGTLKEFMEWGMKNYPAKHYALVMWDHGAGFKGSMTDDETKHLIDNRELRDALKGVEQDTGNKVDVLNFNACLMGQAEVAYELRDAAKYLVGSEEVEAGLRIPIPGLVGTTPQHKVMTDLKEGIKEKGEVTPEELAKLYVFEAKNQFGQTMFTPTQSAIDLSKMEQVKTDADEVAKSLLDEIKKDPATIDIIRKDIKNTQRFLNYDMYAKPYLDYRDMGDFARVLMNDPHFKGTAVEENAKKLFEAVSNAVIAEEHALESFSGRVMEGSTGMSTYLPKNYGHDPMGNNPIDNVPAGGTHGYENTSFAKDTNWDELLQTISKDDEKLGKIIGKYPKINKYLETALPIAQMEGYEQAWSAALSHATKPTGGFLPLTSFPYILPLPGVVAAGAGILGGALRTSKGVEKIATSATKDFAPGKNMKLTLSGIVDSIVGVGSIVTCAALLAGMPAIAAPAGAVVLGLGGGSALLSLGGGVLKAYKASKMSVSEKLQSMEKSAAAQEQAEPQKNESAKASE